MGQLDPDVAPLFGKVYDPQDLMWLPIFFSPSEDEPSRGSPIPGAHPGANRGPRRPGLGGHGRRSFGGAPGPGARLLPGATTTSRRSAQPALVVNGSNDIVVATVNSYILQQNLPNAELILFPDSNHGSHFQFTDPFNRYLTDFLDR